MNRKASLFLCAAASAVTLASADHASTLLYATDFNSATAGHSGDFSGGADYTDGPIIGQDGWLSTGTSTVNVINVTNTLSNGIVPLVTTGQDVNRVFAPPVTGIGSSVFLSADINVSAAQATGDYFIHLGDGGTSAFFDRVYVKSTTGGFLMGLATSSGTPIYGTNVLALNTSTRFVAEYDSVPGTNNDTVELYVNPIDPVNGDGTSAASLYVIGATTGVDATNIASVNLRQGNSANAATLTVDNIEVAVVAPAPEPAALGLIGAGLLMTLRRRRQT